MARLAVGLALLAAGRAGAGDAAGPQTAPPPAARLTRADAWFAVGTVVAVGGAAFADHELRSRAVATDGTGARNLARVVEPLGAPEVVGPALVATWLAGRALGRPRLEAAGRRVGLSVAVAGAAAGAVKLAVGRLRPPEAAIQSDDYQPFSGHASFPSGHATLAFAAAVALDRETQAAWVPWVVFPLATLVGWSRVRDDRHWTSDVVAGAALGGWTAAKTYDWLRAREARSAGLGLRIGPGPGGHGLGAHVSF